MRKDYLKNRKNFVKMEKWKKFLKISKYIFLYSILILVILLVGLTGYFIKEYKPVFDDIYGEASEISKNIKDDDFKNRSNSYIYYEDGSVMKKLNLNDYTYINYKDIPTDVEDALLSIEDIRYYEHNGVDLKSIARAGVELIKNKGNITQGGSTVTQQLVKLKFLTLEKSYERKLKEVIIAYNLEKKYSKEEILEFYLNNINYGSGAYGIASASKKYFQKDISELSLSEIAFLTGIPNNPSTYNPIYNFDNTLKRRNTILGQLLKYEKISEKEYQSAVKEQIILNVLDESYEEDNYDVSFIISSAAKEYMKSNDFEFRYWFNSVEERNAYLNEYNAAFKEAESFIRSSGLKIYSTIEKDKQNLLQKVVNDSMYDYKSKGENGLYKTQASAVSIDNEKGTLVAIIGGRTQDDIKNTYNRAYLSLRQPGSAIKPLLVYLPALQEGVLSTDIYKDAKHEKGPNNVDLRYRGNMNVSEAVARSVNTIPYYLTLKYGALNLLNYLVELEFSGLDYRDVNNTIGIGGFTYGTNTYEMAKGYYSIYNDGNYQNMTGIKYINDMYGEMFYKDKKEEKPVYDSGTAYLMTDMLKGVFNESYGTSYKNRLARDDIEAAAKTGTTNGYRDLWFAGYTPYYTTTVWVGNDNPAELRMGSEYTKKIFKKYMDSVHKDKNPASFKKPSRIMELYLDKRTGKFSDSAFSGGTKQLVTAVYLEKLEAKKQAAEIKKRAEEMARQEKLREEKERKALKRSQELTNLGMNESDVIAEYNKGLGFIEELKKVTLLTSADYEKYKSVIKSVNDKVSIIRFSENFSEIKNMYEEQHSRIIKEYENLLSAEKQAEEARLEEEYKAKLETEFKEDLETEIRKDYEDTIENLEQENKDKDEIINTKDNVINNNKTDLEGNKDSNTNTNTNSNTNSNSNSNGSATVNPEINDNNVDLNSNESDNSNP